MSAGSYTSQNSRKSPESDFDGLSGWIDVHTHLNFLKDHSPEQAVCEGQAVGVERFITIGTEPSDHSIVLELARKHDPVVACTLGVHPHEGQVYSDEIEAFIEGHATEPFVVAIGEIGLDYYYEHSPPEAQRQSFRRQLEVASRLGLPVEIHTRDAEADTIDILSEFRGRVAGLIHCFTGTIDLAKKALDLGFDISFSGVITFKNADSLREVVAYVPLDRLHVETDAPYLTPVPHRGTSNVPAFVVHTAQKVAELKGVGTRDLLDATRTNARRIFPKLKL